MTQPTPDTGRAEFLSWLDEWFGALQPLSLRSEELLPGGDPERVAILVVDLVVGFCSEGPLASARVGALGPKAAEFLTWARGAGVHHVLLAADAHPEDSPEFQAFPPHCIRGTREAELIPELTELSAFSEMIVVPKGSLNVGVEAAFQEWHAAHPEVRTWIVIGDCTDLCVYHAAMHLRTRANTEGRDLTVCVPADLVDTFDLPVATARQIGALPHDAELMHRLFLYHLALNGVRVVSEITA
jgi:nicotinamidase-related amidase